MMEESAVIARNDQPLMMPLWGTATVKHLEKSQLLLRSFRNSRLSDDEPALDLAYEREQSKWLLYQNILLRREAEAKGNLPVEELLNSLEPILIDIANLPDRPSPEEVRPIKERIQKKEIVPEEKPATAGSTEFDLEVND